jgi:uncharacterized protein YecE (DUF72 family)
MTDIRIGISGWTYKPWRGDFYPEGLPHKRELAHASSIFNSIEVNGTFYGLQRPKAFAGWAEATPDDFVFSVKGSRYITHMLKLSEPETPVANFLASGVLRLGRKLGPILWQFPPFFRFDAARLEAFLALLPRDGDAAIRLARKHDHRLKDRAWLTFNRRQRLRHAVEIRHESFRDPAFPKLLRKYGAALVCADTVEWPLLMDLTTDFVYVRLHGSTELYRSGYGRAALDRWARRVRAWAEGREMTDGNFIDGKSSSRSSKPRRRDVYVYFDNTDKRRAPDDARALMRRLGVE